MYAHGALIALPRTVGLDGTGAADADPDADEAAVTVEGPFAEVETGAVEAEREGEEAETTDEVAVGAVVSCDPDPTAEGTVSDEATVEGLAIAEEDDGPEL